MKMRGTLLDHLPIGGGEFLLPFDPVDEFGHFLVVPALFDKGFQVVVASGVEQTETGEVALGAKLLRSGGGGGGRALLNN